MAIKSVSEQVKDLLTVAFKDGTMIVSLGDDQLSSTPARWDADGKRLVTSHPVHMSYGLDVAQEIETLMERATRFLEAYNAGMELNGFSLKFSGPLGVRIVKSFHAPVAVREVTITEDWASEGSSTSRESLLVELDDTISQSPNVQDMYLVTDSHRENVIGFAVAFADGGRNFFMIGDTLEFGEYGDLFTKPKSQPSGVEMPELPSHADNTCPCTNPYCQA